LPGWSAVITQVPAARPLTTLPATVQIDGVVLPNVTGSPEASKAFLASMRKPFDERVALLASDPKAAAIVKSHGLTARDYSVGILALRAAAWASGGGRGGLANLASPANVNLFKSNRELQDAFAKAEAGRVAPSK
jgi:hypothetical protein